MNLCASIREISYNKFVVVFDGIDFSNELDLLTAADLVRRLENSSRIRSGQPTLTKDDMPEILAELAGTDAADAKAECDAHTWKTCSTGGCTAGGRKCSEFMKLWDAAHHLLNWTRAPFATINRWGRREGHLTMGMALAVVSANGGSVIKAPAGAEEAEMAVRAELKAQSDARVAELRASRVATGRRTPRRSF